MTNSNESALPTPYVFRLHGGSELAYRPGMVARAGVSISTVAEPVVESGFKDSDTLQERYAGQIVTATARLLPAYQNPFNPDDQQETHLETPVITSGYSLPLVNIVRTEAQDPTDRFNDFIARANGANRFSALGLTIFGDDKAFAAMDKVGQPDAGTPFPDASKTAEISAYEVSVLLPRAWEALSGFMLDQALIKMQQEAALAESTPQE